MWSCKLSMDLTELKTMLKNGEKSDWKVNHKLNTFYYYDTMLSI